MRRSPLFRLGCSHGRAVVGTVRQQLSGRSALAGQDRPAYARLPAAWLESSFEHSSRHKARVYAVHTKPRQEKALAERLDAAGVSCYLPLTTRLRSWEHRRRIVQEPLFAGYIF